jgi:hypothetical protein
LLIDEGGDAAAGVLRGATTRLDRLRLHRRFWLLDGSVHVRERKVGHPGRLLVELGRLRGSLFSGQQVLEYALAVGRELVEADAHAGRAATLGGVGLADPHDRAVAGEERGSILELELELQGCADGQRLGGADEDAALADVHRIPLDELLQIGSLELDLQRYGTGHVRCPRGVGLGCSVPGLESAFGFR